MTRYEIIGPRMNPGSAMTYKIWDNQKQDYIQHDEHAWDREFYPKEEAEHEIKRLVQEDVDDSST